MKGFPNCDCASKKIFSLTGWSEAFKQALAKLPSRFFPETYPYKTVNVSYFGPGTHPLIPPPGCFIFSGSYLEWLWTANVNHDPNSVQFFLSILQQRDFMEDIFFMLKDPQPVNLSKVMAIYAKNPRSFLLDHYVMVHSKSGILARMEDYRKRFPNVMEIMASLPFPSLTMEEVTTNLRTRQMFFFCSGLSCEGLATLLPLQKNQVDRTMGHVFNRTSSLYVWPLPMIHQEKKSSAQEPKFRLAHSYRPISHLFSYVYHESLAEISTSRIYSFTTLTLPSGIDQILNQTDEKCLLQHCSKWAFPCPSFQLSDARELSQSLAAGQVNKDLSLRFKHWISCFVPWGILIVPEENDEGEADTNFQFVHGYLFQVYCSIFLGCDNPQVKKGIQMRLLLLENRYLPYPFLLIFRTLFHGENFVECALWQSALSKSGSFLTKYPQHPVSKDLYGFFYEYFLNWKKNPQWLTVATDMADSLLKEEFKKFCSLFISKAETWSDLEQKKRYFASLYFNLSMLRLFNAIFEKQQQQSKLDAKRFFFSQGKIAFEANDLKFFDGENFHKKVNSFSYSPFFQSFMTHTLCNPRLLFLHFVINPKTHVYSLMKQSYLVMQILSILATNGNSRNIEDQIVVLVDQTVLMNTPLLRNLKDLQIDFIFLSSWTSAITYEKDQIQSAQVLLLHPDLFLRNPETWKQISNSQYFKWIMETPKNYLLIAIEMFQERFHLNVPVLYGNLIIFGEIQESFTNSNLKGFDLLRQFLHLPTQVNSGQSRLDFRDQKIMDLILRVYGIAVSFEKKLLETFQERNPIQDFLYEYGQSNLFVHSRLEIIGSDPVDHEITTELKRRSFLATLKKSQSYAKERILLVSTSSPGLTTSLRRLQSLVQDNQVHKNRFIDTWYNWTKSCAERDLYRDSNAVLLALKLYSLWTEGKKFAPIPIDKNHVFIRQPPGLSWDTLKKDLVASANLIFRAHSLNVVPNWNLAAATCPTTPIERTKKEELKDAPLLCSQCGMTYDFMYRLFDSKYVNIEVERKIYFDLDGKSEIPFFVDIKHENEDLLGQHRPCRLCWFCLKRSIGGNTTVAFRKEEKDPTCSSLLKVYVFTTCSTGKKSVKRKATLSESNSTWNQRICFCPLTKCPQSNTSLRAAISPYITVGAIFQDKKTNLQILKIPRPERNAPPATVTHHRQEATQICLLCGKNMLDDLLSDIYQFSCTHTFCSECVHVDTSTTQSPSQWPDSGTCPVCNTIQSLSGVQKITTDELKGKLSSSFSYPFYHINHTKWEAVESILKENQTDVCYIFLSEYHESLCRLRMLLYREKQIQVCYPRSKKGHFSFFDQAQSYLQKNSSLHQSLILVHISEFMASIAEHHVPLWSEDVKTPSKVELVFLDYDYTQSTNFYLLNLTLLPQDEKIETQVTWIRSQDSFDELCGRVFDQEMRNVNPSTIVIGSRPVPSVAESDSLLFNLGRKTLPKFISPFDEKKNTPPSKSSSSSTKSLIGLPSQTDLKSKDSSVKFLGQSRTQIISEEADRLEKLFPFPKFEVSTASDIPINQNLVKDPYHLEGHQNQHPDFDDETITFFKLLGLSYIIGFKKLIESVEPKDLSEMENKQKEVIIPTKKKTKKRKLKKFGT